MMLQNLIFSYFGCKVKQNLCYFQIFSTKKHVIQHKSDINHFIYPKKQSYINKLSLTLLHMKRIVLITGGQRSGKSVQAEKMALSLTDRPVYLGTAMDEHRGGEIPEPPRCHGTCGGGGLHHAVVHQFLLQAGRARMGTAHGGGCPEGNRRGVRPVHQPGCHVHLRDQRDWERRGEC